MIKEGDLPYGIENMRNFKKGGVHANLLEVL